MQLTANPYLSSLMAAGGGSKSLESLLGGGSKSLESILSGQLSVSLPPVAPNKQSLSPNSTSRMFCGLMSSAPVRRYKQYSEDSLQAALKEIMDGQSINR